MKFLLWSAPVLCLWPGLAFAQASEITPEYTREGGVLYVVDGTRRFQVSDVVSVRFRDDVGGLDGYRGRVAASPAVQGLVTLRANRLGIHDLRVPADADVLDVVAELRASGLVEMAETNTYGEYVSIPNDSLFASQWHFRNTGQTGGTPNADVDADLAWDLTTGDPSVIVSVLDSGTEVTHVDLVQNHWTNLGEIPANGIDDDGNGLIDDVDGWDFYNNNNNVAGPYFHGTFVAGIVGARTNNGTGVAGLAGGFGATDGCTFMAVGVGDNFPDGSIIDDAIIYASDNGGDIITLSFTIGETTAVNDAITYAHDTRGLFVNCASGNSGSVGYPATNPLVVAVNATTHNDTQSFASAVGPQNFVCAPGENVRSTTTGGGYDISSGTSFASPHVAATAALVLSVFPTLEPDEVADILKRSAKDLGPAGFDNVFGWGRINAHDAVQLALDSDCNGNGVYDPTEIALGAPDANGNLIPDECECCGVSYCSPAVANSTGFPGSMAVSGSDIVSDDDLVLTATQLPPENNIGYFIMGQGMNVTMPPGSAGPICVTPGLLRYLPPVENTQELAGGFTRSVGTSGPVSGSITAGSTWNFQAWHRDLLAGTSNLTDAVSVVFQ